MFDDLLDNDAAARREAAAVGANYDYYRARWTPLRHGQAGRAGFNWPAFLFGALWLGYRKMYKAVVVYCCIVAAFALLGGAALDSGLASNLLTLVLAVVFGLWGNVWYYRHVENLVQRVATPGASEQDVLEVLARRGGTSHLGTFAALGVFVVIGAVVFAFTSLFAVY